MSGSADYPKAIVLSDGRHLELRAASAGEVATLVRDEGACEPVLAVGAWDGPQLAGVVRLVHTAPRIAEVRIALEAEYRGKRLGTWLLLDAVHAAATLDLDGLVAERPSDPEHTAALRHLDFVATAGTTRLVKTLHRGWPRF